MNVSPPLKKASRGRRLLQRVGLVLLGGVVALLLAEGFLWLIGYTYTPLSIQVIKDRGDWRYHHAFEDKHFMYDPHLIWRPRPDAPGFNAQGYRGRELAPEKAPEEYRIFAVGDSNTLGWMGKGNPNWPAFLEQLLNEEGGRPFTVTNAGAYGYSSFQGVRRFEEALRYQPDMALISFGCNDAARVTTSDAAFASRPIRQTRLDTVLMRARTGQLVLACADKLFSRGREGLVPRVSVAEYKDNLDAIIRGGRERGIQIVLLTRPFTVMPNESHDELWWKNFAPEYNAATLEVGANQGVPVIDVAGHFADKQELFVDESHFTKRGYHVAARLIRDRIRPLLGDRDRRVVP